MTIRRHRIAAVVVATASATAAAWLLLFIAPELIDSHRDSALLAAIGLLIGVPAVVAWGGTRLWPFLVPKDHDDD